MAKAKFKLELKDLTNPQLIQKSRSIVTQSTGKPLATTAVLNAITTATDALDNKGQEIEAHNQQGKALTDQQTALRTALGGLLDGLGTTVEKGSDGDAVTIQQYGYDVRDVSTTPNGQLAQPQNLVVLAGDNDGELDPDWDSVKGTKTYELQSSHDPIAPTSWTAAAMVTKSKATVPGLTTGTKYWFRVRAIGSAGPGPWSDPATKVAP